MFSSDGLLQGLDSALLPDSCGAQSHQSGSGLPHTPSAKRMSRVHAFVVHRYKLLHHIAPYAHNNKPRPFDLLCPHSTVKLTCYERWRQCTVGTIYGWSELWLLFTSQTGSWLVVKTRPAATVCNAFGVCKACIPPSPSLRQKYDLLHLRYNFTETTMQAEKVKSKKEGYH